MVYFTLPDIEIRTSPFAPRWSSTRVAWRSGVVSVSQCPIFRPWMRLSARSSRPRRQPLAWIRTIDDPDPGSALRRIYEEQRTQSGAIANILRVHILAPQILVAHLGLYKTTLHCAVPLSQRVCAMIEVPVYRDIPCEH